MPSSPEKAKENSRRHRQRLKRDALEAYGGPKCSCAGCDVAVQEFLALDHVNGGGNDHRRFDTKGGGSKLYQWLKTNGYPGGFRVLCHNCNLGRQINGGVCPHVDRDGLLPAGVPDRGGPVQGGEGTPGEPGDRPDPEGLRGPAGDGGVLHGPDAPVHQTRDVD
jgi:hypothetical protein